MNHFISDCKSKKIFQDFILILDFQIKFNHFFLKLKLIKILKENFKSIHSLIFLPFVDLIHFNFIQVNDEFEYFKMNKERIFNINFQNSEFLSFLFHMNLIHQ